MLPRNPEISEGICLNCFCWIAFYSMEILNRGMKRKSTVHSTVLGMYRILQTLLRMSQREGLRAGGVSVLLLHMWIVDES